MVWTIQGCSKKSSCVAFLSCEPDDRYHRRQSDIGWLIILSSPEQLAEFAEHSCERVVELPPKLLLGLRSSRGWGTREREYISYDVEYRVQFERFRFVFVMKVHALILFEGWINLEEWWPIAKRIIGSIMNC
jgi:hypothetical protein